MEMPQIGKLIVVAGVALVVIGLLIWFAGEKFGWFGNLPGDIKIERENVRIYFPLVTMLLLSLLISGLIWLFNRFF